MNQDNVINLLLRHEKTPEDGFLRIFHFDIDSRVSSFHFVYYFGTINLLTYLSWDFSVSIPQNLKRFASQEPIPQDNVSNG